MFVFKGTHTTTRQCEEDYMWVMWQWLLYLSTVNCLPEIPTTIAHSAEALHDQSPFSVNVLDTGLELQLNSEQQYS